MDKIPVTKKGFVVLEAELKHLKTTARPTVIEAIAVAREHGDLKENAEYHAAREQQSFIEGRILELEAVVSRAQIIDPSLMKPLTKKQNIKSLVNTKPMRIVKNYPLPPLFAAP